MYFSSTQLYWAIFLDDCEFLGVIIRQEEVCAKQCHTLLTFSDQEVPTNWSLFFYYVDCFLTFISNGGNLIFFVIERFSIIKKSKKWRRTGWKMEMKICNFLSTLFRNKDFISQESPILADVENNVFWFRIEIFFKKWA